MHIALAALFFFAILTLWVPAYWPVSVFQVGVFALAGITVCHGVRHPLRFAWPIVPFCFAICWGLFQWFTGRTAYTFATQSAIVHWSTFLAVLFIGISIFREAPVRDWFQSAMLWFGFLVSLIATLQNFTSGGRIFWLFPSGYSDLVMGPILYHNHYAAFIEVVLPIALCRALSRERGALLYVGMTAAMYASVIASASRAGSVLATAEIVVVIGIIWLRGRATGRTVGVSALGIAALCAVFVLVVGPEIVWIRFQAPDPMSLRREVAVSSLEMIAAHPWFGVGLGTWPTVYPRYAIADFGAFVNQAHCDWLQWTAEGGIAFGLMLASLFIWSFRHTWRSVWGLGLIAVFLHAAVDYPFSRPALGSWPILIMAMLAAKNLTPPSTSESVPHGANRKPESSGAASS